MNVVNSRLTSMSVLSGEVVLEAATDGVRTTADPRTIARALLAAGDGDLVIDDLVWPSEPTEGDAIGDLRDDWTRLGWSRSLEYFEWTLRSQPGPSPAGYEANPIAGSADQGWRALLQRKTHRMFDDTRTVSLDLVQDLARAILDRPAHERRGVGVWLISYAVDGVGVGILRLPDGAPTRPPGDDLRTVMREAMCGMLAPLTAAGTLVITYDVDERQRAYPYERAFRELFVETGMLAQAAVITAECADLGCLVTPAANDHTLSRLLDLETSEIPVYSITFGHKRPSSSTQR